MIKEIAANSILGISTVGITGILTYLLFIIAALISIANARGIKFINFKWHPRIAFIALVFAAIHAILAIFT
jgi:predicted ferric reductase